MSLRAVPLALACAAALLVPTAAVAKTATHAGLWATVNVCDTPAKPGAVGIRVSIPPEEGAPQQWARIRLQWWDGSARAWRSMGASGDGGWKRVGIGTRQVQAGTTFTFAPPPAGSRIVLRGVVDVEWRDGKKAVDHARLQTTDGHAVASDVHRRVSRSSCQIMR